MSDKKKQEHYRSFLPCIFPIDSGFVRFIDDVFWCTVYQPTLKSINEEDFFYG